MPFSGIPTVQESILENKGSTVPLGIEYLRKSVLQWLGTISQDLKTCTKVVSRNKVTNRITMTKVSYFWLPFMIIFTDHFLVSLSTITSLIQRFNSPFKVCHSPQQLQSEDGHPLLSVTFIDKEPGQRTIPQMTALTHIISQHYFADFGLRQ